MTENEIKYDHLVQFICDAVESEQVDNSEPFNDETERRLKLVFINLKEILNLTPDIS